MFTSIHALIYSDDAPATRSFFRDVLQLPYVGMPDEDLGSDGWLIFKSGPSEVGIHPTAGERGGPRPHQISLMCDDLESTVATLRTRGAEFTGEIENHGYGLVVMVKVPGADDIQIYQPLHPTAFDL